MCGVSMTVWTLPAADLDLNYSPKVDAVLPRTSRGQWPSQSLQTLPDHALKSKNEGERGGTNPSTLVFLNIFETALDNVPDGNGEGRKEQRGIMEGKKWTPEFGWARDAQKEGRENKNGSCQWKTRVGRWKERWIYAGSFSSFNRCHHSFDPPPAATA